MVWLQFFLLMLSAAAAQEISPERRMLDDTEAVEFRGVGRLNVAGTRFCTATLVSERQILTAAHCLYHPRSFAPVPLAEMRFVAGKRRDVVAAVRGIARAAVPEDFGFDGQPRFGHLRRDIALLELDAAISAADLPAFVPGDLPRDTAGDTPQLEVVSYGVERREAASIQRDCTVRATIGQVVALDCGVNFGASGAPVFLFDGELRRLWAVVASTGTEGDDMPVTLTVQAAPEMKRLAARLAETVPDVGRPASDP